MAITKQNILDLAMRHLGASAFTDGDGSKGDLVTDDIYDVLLEDLLRSHNWNFNTRRVELTDSTDTPIGYDYGYSLPSDFVRVVQVSVNNAWTGDPPDYKVEWLDDERQLLCSSPDVWLRYVADITDLDEVPYDFWMAFSLALARDSALAMTSSNTLYDVLDKRFDRKMGQARSTDSLEQRADRRPRGSWHDSRGRRLPIVGTT